MSRSLLPAALVAVAMVSAGCAAFNIQPSAEMTSLNPAWQNWFRFDYAVDEDKAGKRRISGYPQNNYGEAAHDIRILLQALDKSGAIVAQQITWGSFVPGLSRSYFELRNVPAADQYRLSVWDFTFDQAPGWI